MRRSTTVNRLKKALEIIQRPLAELPVDKFEMETYGDKSECGTAACGIGTLSLDPEMRKLGLRGKWVQRSWHRGSSATLVPQPNHPDLAGHEGWEFMTKKVFGIDCLEAHFLAHDNENVLDHNFRLGKHRKITKAAFANRLKNLIKRYEQPEMRDAA